MSPESVQLWIEIKRFGQKPSKSALRPLMHNVALPDSKNELYANGHKAQNYIF